MLRQRVFQLILIVLIVASFGGSGWMKDYIISRQSAWNGRTDVIRIYAFGDLLAPRALGIIYVAACLAPFAFIAILALVSRKRS